VQLRVGWRLFERHSYHHNTQALKRSTPLKKSVELDQAELINVG
jgi:hypothetical protein